MNISQCGTEKQEKGNEACPQGRATISQNRHRNSLFRLRIVADRRSVGCQDSAKKRGALPDATVYTLVQNIKHRLFRADTGRVGVSEGPERPCKTDRIRAEIGTSIEIEDDVVAPSSRFAGCLIKLVHEERFTRRSSLQD